jgi:hypothetical protein
VERYDNRSGNSGVAGYECGADFIRVQFSEGSIYRYTYGSAGAANIESMKRLARGGKGLSTFIATSVREKYASKER